MKRRLTLKFALAYLLFGLLSFFLIAVLGSRSFTRAAAETEAEELYYSARMIASYQSNSYSSPNQYQLANLNAVRDMTGLRILILNPEYRIVYDSSSELTGRSLSAFDPADSEEYYRIGQFYGAFSEEMLSVFTPIIDDLSTKGYVTMHRNYRDVTARADIMLRRAYLLFLYIFAASLLILVFFILIVLRPLNKITAGASALAAGNLKYRIKVESRDEVGYLADTLNLMAEELESANDYQKKFIANVSHDFRSPLTSIKGYLQAMIDGVIPEENREKYMQVIIGETDRLTNLTQQMLSLNSLDSKRLTLELSDFDLADMVKALCETFEGICLQRNISFDLVFSAPAIYVHADMGRIQQVMSNLIDNAVKFSHDGGTVKIRIYELGEKVSVSVKDHGVGIAKEELNKIWSRFYKSDSSRGKDKKGTGLGLSIVKEILNAHGETIDVVSTLGSGTEFIFHLPMHD